MAGDWKVNAGRLWAVGATTALIAGLAAVIVWLFATQVFDEVDAGIGGETAHAVGALLRSLSDGGQALCVTHLAQVAVFADRQIQVQKKSGDSETRIETSLLAEAERVCEYLRGRLAAADIRREHGALPAGRRLRAR